MLILSKCYSLFWYYQWYDYWLAFPREVIKFLQLLFFPNIFNLTVFVFPLTFLQIPRIISFLCRNHWTIATAKIEIRTLTAEFISNIGSFLLTNSKHESSSLALESSSWLVYQSLDLDPFPLLKKVKNIIPDYWYFQPYFPSFTWCFLEISI